ncbi:hypothetical protein [Lachnoanaerobaculum orale]|uniref:hypothetical protein n=1 Tax=Lachnoanaerobaculum orale TaxID=979627 RepID=UPI0023A7A9C0|nr:hypothetical protein [Lachnoanaerobaculum orale]
MKDFQDFIDLISHEDMTAIISRAESFSPEKSQQVFMTALNLLEYYHNWLNSDNPN